MDEPCEHYRKPHPFFPRPIGRRCAECEAEEYAAWQTSVRTKLNKALAHVALGMPYNWDELPCTAYPNCGLLADGSHIQTTTAGELADWLAENPPAPCGCENPQPFDLCCPPVVLIPAVRPLRDRAPKRKRKRR